MTDPDSYTKAGVCSDSVRPKEGRDPQSIDLTVNDNVTNNPQGNAPNQGRALKGSFGGPDKPIQSGVEGNAPSVNLLNLADVRGTKKPTSKGSSDKKPFNEQFPRAQPGSSSAPTKTKQGGRPTSGADEISDREMAAFYFDQRSTGRSYDARSETSQPAVYSEGSSNNAGGGTGDDGEEPSVSQERVNESADDSCNSDSYSQVASKGDWSPPVQNNKRKWDRRDRKP